MLATMAMAAAGFSQSPRLAGLGGLFQRASIVTGFGWLHNPIRASAAARPCRPHRQTTSNPNSSNPIRQNLRPVVCRC